MAEEEEINFLEKENILQVLKSVPEAKSLVSLTTCPICYSLMVSRKGLKCYYFARYEQV